MVNISKTDIKKAKRVKFSCVTREGRQTATRNVISCDDTYVYVRFNGWNPFYLKYKEIIEIIT